MARRLRLPLPVVPFEAGRHVVVNMRRDGDASNELRTRSTSKLAGRVFRVTRVVLSARLALVLKENME